MVLMSQNAIPRSRARLAGSAAEQALARRQASYEDEVRRLLDAGLSVMVSAGTATSPRVADIVRAAGLSNDAFYRHFAGKEELVAAIVAAGTERLVGYLAHQMGKEREPARQVRRWVEGVMSQAADPAVAEATRSVLWNGGRVTDASRPSAGTNYDSLAALLVEPIRAMGSRDPQRDATVVCQAAMGRMSDFLWRRAQPSRRDITHLVSFCLAAVTPPGR